MIIMAAYWAFGWACAFAVVRTSIRNNLTVDVIEGFATFVMVILIWPALVASSLIDHFAAKR